MGYEYKCAAAPKELIIKKQAEMDKAVAGFANIYNAIMKMAYINRKICSNPVATAIRCN